MKGKDIFDNYRSKSTEYSSILKSIYSNALFFDYVESFFEMLETAEKQNKKLHVKFDKNTYQDEIILSDISII